MEKRAFLHLVDRYLNSDTSPAEERLILEYYNRLGADAGGIINEEESEILKQSMLRNIRSSIQPEVINSQGKYRRLGMQWLPYVAAACILILFSVTLVFDLREGTPKKEQKKLSKLLIKNDVDPGGNKAILTLGDGSRIVLDDVESGEIVNEGGIRISKLADGQLLYSVNAKKQANSLGTLNKIETPRGGQFQIHLPDGSKVWLNAASVLSFPTVFQDNERKVELVGEAYFEVARVKSMPFRVHSNNQVVEVLGTYFNINSYSDESSVTTTLLEGSVKVTGTSLDKTQFLKPGQAAVNRRGAIAVNPANTEQAIAWKNGAFIFNDMKLIAIMRQLERWYDIDVDYSSLPDTRFNIHVSRNINLSEVLKTLEVTGRIKFLIDQKRVTVIRY